MTLTDFLLARIAEDEAIARGGVPSGFARESYYVRRFRPARVLIESGTKRAVVEIADGIMEDGAGWLILRHMATAYVDHPDYREEWRA